MTMVQTMTRQAGPGGIRVSEGQGTPSPGARTRTAGAVHRLVSETAIWGGRVESATEAAIHALVTLCVDDLLTGDWDELLRVANEALGLCEAHGYRELRWPFWFAGGIVAAARGQQTKAHELADRIDQWGGRRACVDVQLYARFLRCQAAEATGDYDRAFREISVLGVPSVFSANLSLSMWASLDFVSCAVRANQQDAAEAFVTMTAAVDTETLSPRVHLLTACASAIATTAPADGVVEGIVETPDLGRWPFDLARVELARGEGLRRGRSLVEARSHLARASALFEGLGAKPWLDRAQQELRASGGQRTGRGVARGTALTPQEQEIAELAARGLTNRQIAATIYLSPRTVSAHLYRIFPKLGVSSRAALRDALVGTTAGSIEAGPPVH
jgi:DNA-binding CsgD family transcriptional regulator